MKKSGRSRSSSSRRRRGTTGIASIDKSIEKLDKSIDKSIAFTEKSIEETAKKMEKSYKSLDTEEHIDIYFNRPIGYLWALLFKKLHICPNVVTILSIILGVCSAVCFYFPDLPHTIAGIILLMWANHYDSADGQLARLTGQTSALGRFLDGIAGDIWFFSIYVSISLRLTNEPLPFHLFGDHTWGIWIWLLTIFSGIYCHGRHCSLADYYRNIHLYFLNGKAGSELDNAAQQEALYRSLTWKDHFWQKCMLFCYMPYTRRQEKMTPAFQRFYALLHDRYGEDIPQTVRDDFRHKSKPLLKYTNILTFNIRAIALYVSMLCQHPEAYVFFEIIVLSAVFVYMHRRHEAMCRDLYEKYADE